MFLILNCFAVQRLDKFILYGKDRTRLGVTNLGVLSIAKDYDTFKITKIIPIAPNVATSEKVITISTYDGKMLIADNSIVRK